MFPSTSFWGKPWRFGPLIAFSASCTVSDASFRYWTYKSMSSFGLRKQLAVFPFLISGLLWKIGDAGHRSPYLPHAKRALYHLSYIPVEETGSYCLIEPSPCYWNSSTASSIAWLCRCGSSIHFFLTCQSLALPIDMPSWWGPRELFLSEGCLWFTHQYSNLFVRHLSEVNLGDSGLQSLSQQVLYCFRCFLSILHVQIHVFFRFSKLLISFFDFFFEKLEMRGPRSPYLSHSKQALFHLSYIPSEERGS